MMRKILSAQIFKKEGIELQNQEILEADTIKQKKMKEKIRKEYLR